MSRIITNYLLTLFLMSTIICGVLTGHADFLENLPPEIQPLYNSDLDTWKPPEHLKRNYPYYLSGFDEEDRPVWVLEFGKWNLRDIVEQGKDAVIEFDKYVNQVILNVYNSTITKHEIVPAIIILDLDEYELSQLTSPATVAYYVEKLRLIVIAMKNLHAAYCINTNFVAQRFLNLIKPLLGKEFEKFEIYGNNPAKWKSRILKTIPSDQLPSWYGGSSNFKPVMIYG
ncbi:unnamed protein product [Allacma fusca]|uniref:CRAL-TRIO domain-containing protein n=1 Tax=Allacma fusca TaxID=39272 RepID=A0A8J2JWC2_9HEXA|nr:unnamed protein product [Allacma fusca]